MSHWVLPLLVAAASVFGSEPDEMNVFRLPDTTRPISYRLSIKPYYPDVESTGAAVDFDGEVDITIEATVPTSNITLNSKGLLVYVVYVYEELTKSDVDVIHDYRNDTRNEQLTVQLDSQLRVGVRYRVNIEFHGRTEPGMNGFYKSTYRDRDGRAQ